MRYMSNTGGLKNPLHSWNLGLLDKHSISRTAYLPVFVLLVARVPGFVALGSLEYYRTFASCFCVGFLQINTVSSISCFAVAGPILWSDFGSWNPQRFHDLKKKTPLNNPNCWRAGEPIKGACRCRCIYRTRNSHGLSTCPWWRYQDFSMQGCVLLKTAEFSRFLHVAFLKRLNRSHESKAVSTMGWLRLHRLVEE